MALNSPILLILYVIIPFFPAGAAKNECLKSHLQKPLWELDILPMRMPSLFQTLMDSERPWEIMVQLTDEIQVTAVVWASQFLDGRKV